MGGGARPAAPGAAGGGDGESGPARPRGDLRSGVVGPPQGPEGGGTTHPGGVTAAFPAPLPRSSSPGQRRTGAAPPDADPGPAAGETGTAGAGRTGSA
ncbi:collagen alpha-1(I) chain-like [Coturnix japonica]|uniref:collagen alpha-1(I) chain-like n=1 Tax=Coturnix japonica TaxID=93934 RepID=UPI0007774F70|nr:collagen alpha-1(I) chain-like [Coturnix japonica]